MGRKYKWKTTPYLHQIEAVKSLLRRGWGGALLMAPRTGKTKTTIDWISILHMKGEVNRVLIVCPVSVIQVWVNEIETHCPWKCRVTVWDKKGRKDLKLPPMGQDILDVVIINYDAFSTPGALNSRGARTRSGGRFAIRDALRRWQPQCMILDESHRIKSTGAVKTHMIISVAWKEFRPKNSPRYLKELVPYRAILTGTVVTKKKRIFDIYGQWQFLNPYSPLVNYGVKTAPNHDVGDSLDAYRPITLKEFKDRYGVWTNRNGYPQWLRNKEEGETGLKALLHAESFAVTRDECFDLPDRTDQIIPVTLEESGSYYDEMAEEMVAKLKTGEITWAKIPLVQQMRLAQITSGIVKTEPTDKYPEGRTVRIGREKLVILEELLSDLFEADEKVVIAARFRGDIQAIVSIVEKLKGKAFQLHGGISNKRIHGGESERDQNIREFREYDGPGAFIMQPSAGSLGIDLSSSSIFIWFSLTNSWVDFTQANDRIALSKRKTTVMYLQATGTIDELQLEALRDDGDVAKRITDSPDRLLRNFKV